MNYAKYKKEMTWEEYEKILMKRPGFKEAQKETRLEYEIARALIKARIEKGLTQEEIARRMHTKQSVISRVENARTMPSLAFLKRLAAVLNASLKVQFEV
ncbi:helix-turn-helix transcriptional regulator [Candidatus Daviesbacteria bacterium]|nr:helix-turn-helix transcriptional regulator [Candidatus Daviesbacteria bacterium]